MKYCCALITVEDINKSRKFYEEIMEQTVINDYIEDVAFNGFSIHLRSHYKGLINGKNIEKAGNNIELYFEHDNIEEFEKKLKENNVVFIHELREEPWKQKTIRIYDPDGYIIDIGEPMENIK